MLTQLQVHHLRNLRSLKIATKTCNLIVGDNGSGKTSVLESIYLLSRGKSFRQHQPKRYITHHQNAVTVYAQFSSGDSMAVQKNQDAQTMLRFNGQNVLTQSQLTTQLPTLIIDPTSMDVLDIGSSSRRQLLDWLTFHVKPEFHPQWMAYQKILKQRNVLLKRKYRLTDSDHLELQAWDKGLANHANLITHHRQQIFNLWQPKFVEVMTKLLPQYAQHIQLKFLAGYDTNQSLDVILAQKHEQDCQLGYTRVGCHRADVQVIWQSQDMSATDCLVNEFSEVTDECIENTTTNDNNESSFMDSSQSSQSANQSQFEPNLREQATHVLSRGEKKLLITALKLSQLMVIADFQNQSSKNQSQDNNGIVPVVLLDDITAELDSHALQVLLTSLAGLPCQIFITSLDKQLVQTITQYWQDVALFHMKQGQITST